MSLEYYEEKWYTKVKGKADYWAKRVSSDTTYTNYKSGLARAANRDVDDIKEDEGEAAYFYKQFQKVADKLKDKFKSGVEDAHKEKKWMNNWVAAFFKE
jgi:hypothetical protein